MKPVAWMYQRPNGSGKLMWEREPYVSETGVSETALYPHEQMQKLFDAHSHEMHRADKLAQDKQDLMQVVYFLRENNPAVLEDIRRCMVVHDA